MPVPPVIRQPEALLQPHRAVCCNGKILDPNQLRTLDMALGGTVPDGSYWYDARWGAFGRVGEGRERALPAGLDLGGPLPANASLGTTGVFINGRQLGFVEISRTPGIPYLPRHRYWVNANGDFGIEGAAAILGNLQVKAAQAVMLTQFAVAAQFIGHTGGHSGRKESALTTWDRTGVSVFNLS